MIIDLHGMDEQEAITYVLTSLFSLDLHRYDTHLEIIPGKGQGVLLRATLDLLDQENRRYFYQSNKIIVAKKKIENNDFEDSNEFIDQWNKMKEE